MRTFPLALACLLAAIAAPSAAQESQSPYDAAVAARLAGDPVTAVRLLEPWLAANPADTDAQVQLGYAYLALGRLDAAERAFRAVLARAPQYTDASDGLAAVERRRAASEGRRGYLLAEGAIDSVGGPARDWKEAAVSLHVPVAARDTLDLGAAWYQRFGREDASVSALYTLRAADDVWLRLGGTATPSADFRPRAGLAAGIDCRLPGGGRSTVLSLDARWEDFPMQRVWTFSPGLTQYFAGGRASLTARANGVAAQGDRLRVGGLLRADYFPAEGTRAFIGAAAGPDTELGVVTTTRSMFGGGELPLGKRFSLTGSMAREWRKRPADRSEFRLGLKVAL